MVRKVFFSFHYERDIWRVNQIRNNGAFKPVNEAGYIDAAGYETAKVQGDAAIRRWINNNLIGTTVTVILVGTETSNRPWVKYEIQESYKRKNGILAIHIHNVKDNKGMICKKGDCYFGEIAKTINGDPIRFNHLYHEYDWVNDDGYKNFGMWVERAAKEAGK